MRCILSNCSKFPLAELNFDSRASDLEEALEFGNHKGAEKQSELLEKLVKKDIIHGYGLVLPLDKITRVPGALMAPMNIQRQDTIDEFGRIIPKDRLTHDQSYKWKSGTSVNSRVDKSQLQPCMFGAAIRRISNWAVAARRKYPKRRILVSKVDYKSAYRRCHLSGETAIQTCTQLPDLELAIVALRLTFGGAPGSYEWGVISESICDLAIAILQHNDWDPSKLHSPSQNLIPERVVLDDSIPFGEGKELIVDIPVDPRGTTDVYIDDTVGLTVDLPESNNCERLEAAILLAIHTAARPKHPQEPIPREVMEALEKLIAEAGAEETKMILGWFFDFRRLLVSLPDNKFKAWSDAIREMIQTKITTSSILECNIGRLVHLSMVLPGVHHFMSRLRDLLKRSKNRSKIKINQVCLEDLELMLFFLEKAHKGISLNQIVYRRPTHVYRSDSCPSGLGGYSHEGWAWRFYIPYELQGRATNNLLEHIP